MYVETFLVCDAARLDEGGKLHVNGQFYALSAPGFPAKHDMQLVLVLEWDRGDHGRYDFHTELLGPSGKPTGFAIRGGTEVAGAEEGRPRQRTTILQPMEEVIFETPGEYRFQLRVKGRQFDGPRLFLIEGEPSEGS